MKTMSGQVLHVGGVGEIEVSWLQRKDKETIRFFEKVLSLTGIWRNKRMHFWGLYWLTTSIIFFAIFVESTFMLMDDLDMLAYCAHHMVLTIVDIVYLRAVYLNQEKFIIIMEGPSRTYSYGSRIVSDYHHKLMIKLFRSMRFQSIVSVFCGVGTLIFLQVFFILEATVLKTYETMFPMYLPFGIHHPVVFAIVIFFQETVACLTAVMGIGLLAVLFVVWDHLHLELRVLNFALSNIDNLVEEKIESKNLENGHRTDAEREAYEFYCYHFARHHAAIRRYFNIVQESCTHLILVMLFGGFICFVCVGITSFSESLGIRLRFFLVFIVQLCIIYGWFWVSQGICDQGEEIADTVAGTTWWKMTKKCRSTLLLIMVGCKIPLMLTTPFGQKANKESYMDMLASSYRCFNLVYQVTA